MRMKGVSGRGTAYAKALAENDQHSSREKEQKEQDGTQCEISPSRGMTQSALLLHKIFLVLVW